MTLEERERIFNAVFGKTDKCYHFPELKQLVFLCMEESSNKATLQSLMTILDTHLPHDSDRTERDAIRKNIIMELENLLT